MHIVKEAVASLEAHHRGGGRHHHHHHHHHNHRYLSLA